MRKILVTAALPYANGEVHLGHLVEHLLVDVWARSLRMAGHDCHFLCADDTHGTPIMIRARQEGITPEKLIARCYEEHTADFKAFEIGHSYYSSTNSPENKKFCEEFYFSLKKNGLIDIRPVEQLYCPKDLMFLPDRFVKGICPKCGEPNQYGDSCDKCGATYSPTELKNPACVVCGTKPILKSSDHYFVRLNHYKEQLKSWLQSHTTEEVRNKMMEWFKDDLRDWDISRDDPYFGFPIPDATGKYFYVWVDAPVGYVSTTKIWADLTGRKFEDYWKSEDTELYHFIGKDITYFHTLFWPALLMAAGYRTPTKVFAHGFLSVNGEKMSKSKGTFISVLKYRQHLDPTYLRYFLATKLNSKLDDMDLNLDDLINKVNSELIGKIVNLASRSAQMVGKKYAGETVEVSDHELVQASLKRLPAIEKHFEDRELSKALAEIRELAEIANRFFDEKAPWKETDPAIAQKTLSVALSLFRHLAIALSPVVPSLSEKAAELFFEKKSGLQIWENSYSWKMAALPLPKKINAFTALLNRIEKEKVALLTV